ncbi:MAG TPA: primosomal protein N' [Aeromicrobium sp.]|nr:primosomal protein N' [Aeromicrobium sp.]
MIARVAVDTPLPHLDRPFDYAVPDDLADAVVPGCRVKVRFAGRMTDGFVLELVEHSDHPGTLTPLAKVVSSEPVLTSTVAALCREVADRWAGTLNDVLRLAIPPRQARVEARPPTPGVTEVPDPDPSLWVAWPGASAFLDAVAAGESPRAVWSALPATDPAEAVAQAVLATLASGRGAVVCVPDARDVTHWDAVFTRVLGVGAHALFSAAQKPAERYRAYLSVSRGAVQVALGTRTAAFAPVAGLGLVAIFDDGDDLYAEPRAPYPHAREVLLIRALREAAAVLIGGYARSVEAQALVEKGWCTEMVAEPVTRRRRWPALQVAENGDDAPARLPHEVFKAIRSVEGPVLVQVPRRGYRTSLACQQCRTPARCGTCGGPLEQAGAGRDPRCRWCGTDATGWTCGTCGCPEVRAPTIGHLRTAEEYAAAFPDRTVITSGGDAVLDTVSAGDVIVLATPGAEPHVSGGYSLVVLMDTWLMLARDDLRVVEESHRRWFNALALAQEPAKAIAVGDAEALQALVRADPAGLASRELATRTQTHLPPAARVATIDGSAADVERLLERVWTPHTEVLGPLELGDRELRLVLRCPLREGPDLATHVREVQANRSAAKLPPLRVRIDPAML